MYTIVIYHPGKGEKSYKHIDKITYVDILSENIVLSGSDILKHKFPVDRILHFHAGSTCHIINPAIIGSISIHEES